jgi:hypothetical protein
MVTGASRYNESPIGLAAGHALLYRLRSAARVQCGHRLPIAMTRGRPDATRYDRQQRSDPTAVRTREDRE